MPDFPHLTLKQKLDGRYQFSGMRIEKKFEEQTLANLQNREAHGNNLLTATKALSEDYTTFLKEREEQGLPAAFDENTVPVFLQVDPKDFDIESLKGFGIEIVSEEDEGFIIGANGDNFIKLTERIDLFIKEQGQTKNTSMLWQIVQGIQWRVDYILSEELKEKYVAGIKDTDEFIVDISVACYVKSPERPVRVEDESDEDYAALKAKHEEKVKNQPGKKDYRKQKVRETDEGFNIRLERWRKSSERAEFERDEIAYQRQTYLTHFIQNIYNGEILSSFIDLEDSFGFRAKMSGQALKDLIKGYAYVFEITEAEELSVIEKAEEIEGIDEIEIIAPDAESPTFCVIDSGMQEQHILLAPAVLSQYSKNYVPYENTTSDQVKNGGHGTMVAGGIIFGSEIPSTGTYQPPCFLINARILDKDCSLVNTLYPPQLMEQIVDDFDGVRLFNLSVASWVPCKVTHMSAWAATIDKLIHERKILFLLATGNIFRETGSVTRPGIVEHLTAGRSYPGYLLESSSRIANPSQSMLGLTVGSVCLSNFEDADRISFGQKDYISPFSRTGFGMWGCIKPDVVEYGGDMLREKNGYLVTQHNDISSQVVKTGANRTGYSIGTSFATPKVAHIVAELAKKFPNDSTLLYKALVIQSSRLPEHVFHNPREESLRLFGYGIPDKERAIENNPYRITFVAEGNVAAQQANLYFINIPEEIRRAGTNYDILIEVTLTYTSIPRRTRKRLKSYLSSWLSWDSSKLGESFDAFSARVLKNLDDQDGVEEPADNNSIRWAIWSSPTWGAIKNVKRQDSAAQKDWTILKSNQLPEELSFAVIGHKGWDKDIANELPFALVISFEAISQEAEIYNRIEVANQLEVDAAIAINVEQ